MYNMLLVDDETIILEGLSFISLQTESPSGDTILNTTTALGMNCARINVRIT